MVQMAAALSSIINGGSYYEPHVVKQILNEQGAVVKKVEPNLVRETVSQATSEFLVEAMFQTVDHEEGTGKAGRVAGYKVGGKTGTAQKLPRSANNYLLSFAGFAPADDPQLLVYVVIDTPHLPGKEQAHSTFATEVFQKVMADVLPYMNVFPDTEVEEKVDENLANQQEGITNQNQGGLEPSGDGDGAQSEPETDADGNPVEVPTEQYDEEVVVYDDGLGLPDSHAGGSEVIDAFSGQAANVGGPAPGDAVPGETMAASVPKETKPED